MKKFLTLTAIHGGAVEALKRGTYTNPLEIIPGVKDFGKTYFGDDIIEIQRVKYILPTEERDSRSRLYYSAIGSCMGVVLLSVGVFGFFGILDFLDDDY